MLKPKELLRRTTVGVGSFMGRESTLSEIQVTVVGTGAVSAKVQMWGSNDGIGKIDLGTMTATGTTIASASDSVERAYSMLMGEVTAIDGTDAEAVVTFSDHVKD
jgi:hypothetical protein